MLLAQINMEKLSAGHLSSISQCFKELGCPDSTVQLLEKEYSRPFKHYDTENDLIDTMKENSLVNSISTSLCGPKSLNPDLSFDNLIAKHFSVSIYV